MATTCKLNRVDPLDYRPGWDVTCVVTDGVRTQGMTFYWPEKEQPNEKVLALKFQALCDGFDAEKAIVPDTMLSKRDVESLLIEKQLLKTGETLEQLKSLSELTVGVK